MHVLLFYSEHEIHHKTRFIHRAVFFQIVDNRYSSVE